MCDESPYIRLRPLFYKNLAESESTVERGFARARQQKQEGHRRECESVRRPQIPAVNVHQSDCGQHIDGDKKSTESRQQTKNEKDAAEELGEGRDVTEPVWQAEGLDEVSEVIQRDKMIASEAARGNNFWPAVVHHGNAKDDAEQKYAPGLELIEPSSHRYGFRLARLHGRLGDVRGEVLIQEPG